MTDYRLLRKLGNNIKVTINDARLTDYNNIVDVTKDKYYIAITNASPKYKAHYCTPSNNTTTFAAHNLHEITRVTLTKCSGKAVNFVLSHLPNVEVIEVYKCDMSEFPQLPDTVRTLHIVGCNKLKNLKISNCVNMDILNIYDCCGMINNDTNHNMIPPNLTNLFFSNISINCNDLVFPLNGTLTNITIKDTYFTKFDKLPQHKLSNLTIENTGIINLDSHLPKLISKLTLSNQLFLNKIDMIYMPTYIDKLLLICNNIIELDTTLLDIPLNIYIKQEMPIYKDNIKINPEHTIYESKSVDTRAMHIIIRNPDNTTQKITKKTYSIPYTDP